MKCQKAQVSEFILICFSIVISVLILSFAGCQAKTLKAEYEQESIKNIEGEYPVLFVNTFLESYVILDDLEKEELNLDVQGEFKIKDVLIINNLLSKEIIGKEREKYLSKVNSFKVADRDPNLIYDIYKDEGGSYEIFDKESYLLIEYSSEIPNFSNEYSNGIFSTSLLTLNGEYATIYFRK